MADTAKTLLIAGKEYPLVTMEAFTMADALVLYEYSGLTLEDFIPPDPDAEDEDAELERIEGKIRNPGVLAALVHVSYQRGNPTVKKEKVKRVVGETPLMDIYAALADDGEEDDEVPPPKESTSAPGEASQPASVDSSDSSGPSSESTSDLPDATPPPTTPTKSDTSSASDQEISAE